MKAPQGYPDASQVKEAFDAVQAGKTRELQVILYLHAESFHGKKNPDGTGGSLLHAAVERDDVACIQLLIKKKFSVLDTNDEGQNLLHVSKSANAAMLILQNAGKSAVELLTEQDFKGNLPYHSLAQNKRAHALSYLLKVASNAPEMVMRKNAKGNTVMHELAKHVPSLIPSVLSLSMDVRVKNEAGETAQDLCTENKKSKILLGAHMVLKSNLEEEARSFLIRSQKSSSFIKAAEKAKDFIKQDPVLPNSYMQPK